MRTATPQIFYFAYRHSRPTGGQKHTYKHVDILNQNGFRSAVFHPGGPFKLDWFPNTTRILTEAEFFSQIDPVNDYVVLPEDLGPQIAQLPGKKIIFNKNIYHGFSCYGNEQPATYPYLSEDVVAAFCVSKHNCDHLRFAFPRLDVYRMFIEIDPTVFYPPSPFSKKFQVACSTKAHDLIPSLYHTIMARASAGLNNAAAFRWIFINNLDQTETAKLLRESLLFISLSTLEGIGRLPLEAMASGCLVATFKTGPLLESLESYNGYDYGMIIPMIKYIEAVMDCDPSHPNEWSETIDTGYERAKYYSLRRQENTLVSAWKLIIERGL